MHILESNKDWGHMLPFAHKGLSLPALTHFPETYRNSVFWCWYPAVGFGCTLPLGLKSVLPLINALGSVCSCGHAYHNQISPSQVKTPPYWCYNECSFASILPMGPPEACIVFRLSKHSFRVTNLSYWYQFFKNNSIHNTSWNGKSFFSLVKQEGC